jgi:hypothetical protein
MTWVCHSTIGCMISSRNGRAEVYAAQAGRANGEAHGGFLNCSVDR